MKKFQMICLFITIFFCIDYAVTNLLGFHMLYARIKDMDIFSSVFACLLGVCGFIDILLFKKED